MQLDQLIKGFQPTLTEDYAPTSVHCKFTTGSAGCGKTYQQKKLIEENPNYGLLCATTGIAAINLNSTTLNSVLKFFDTDSLRDNFNRGGLASTLHRIGRTTKRLVIDEVSMLDANQLDYIYQAMLQVNEFQDMQVSNAKGGPMGIVLTGDFCQLPPVKAKWAFEAECWEHFERNTDRLTKIYRQDNLEFLEALNAARSGQGSKCAKILSELGVRFSASANNCFTGTTILSKNDQVDNFNYSALLDLPGEAYGLRSTTWGDVSSEWKNIPDLLKLKDGAYVMILSNDASSGEFNYANGDCGYIQSKDIDGTIWVKLVRNEKLVGIRPITRYKSVSSHDFEKNSTKYAVPGDGWVPRHIYCTNDCGLDEPGLRYGPWGEYTYNCNRDTWNVGAIKYYPLRLAYATTVHKSQGLTLDRCQIDVRDRFFGSPSMAYVALSRVRTPEGLSIVGDPGKLAERIRLEPKVKRWL